MTSAAWKSRRYSSSIAPMRAGAALFLGMEDLGAKAARLFAAGCQHRARCGELHRVALADPPRLRRSLSTIGAQRGPVRLHHLSGPAECSLLHQLSEPVARDVEAETNRVRADPEVAGDLFARVAADLSPHEDFALTRT